MLVYLRRIDLRLERIEGSQAAMLERLASLENGQALLRQEVAHIHGEMAHIDHRIDRVEQRLYRIERRFDLVDSSTGDR